MARDQSSIEKSIVAAFPSEFGELGAGIDLSTYESLRNEVVEWSATATGPYLQSETTRYQSILLYTTLLLVTAAAFRWTNLKAGGNSLQFDSAGQKFGIAFLALVAAVFGVKAFIDWQRSKFTSYKNPRAVDELLAFIEDERVQSLIQKYFWLELFNSIGQAYEIVSTQSDTALGIASIPFPISLENAVRLDFPALRTKLYLSAEIGRCERLLTDLRSEFDNDVKAYKDATDHILAKRDNVADELSHRRYEEIQSAYDKHLAAWFGARCQLSMRSLGTAARPSNSFAVISTNDLYKLIRKVRRLQLLYFAMEAVLPLMFSFAGTIYIAMR